MQITFDTKPFAALEADALVTYLFEESDPVQGRISEIDTAAGGLLKKITDPVGVSTGLTLGRSIWTSLRASTEWNWRGWVMTR